MNDLSTTAGKIEDLTAKLGEAAVADTARQRISALVDTCSFTEVDALARHRVTVHGLDADRPATDGVVAGYATVDGRKVCVLSMAGDVLGGRIGEVSGEKIVKVYDLAIKTGVPLISFWEGEGPRAAEGVAAMASYSRILARATRASGLVPQIAVLVGQLDGAQALLPSLADVIVAVEGDTSMRLTPLEIINTVTGNPHDAAEFGADVHATRSGTVHLRASDASHAVSMARELCSFLPSNNRAEAPRLPGNEVTGPVGASLSPTDVELDALIPDSTAQPYDVHEMMERLVDEGAYLELQADCAPNVVTAFARVEGRSVGVVANQPTELAGCLTAAACDKAARFIRTCDSFNIPVLTLVDVPGFLPEVEEEAAGVVRRAAKLAFAYAEAQVGTVTVIVRKAVGAAGCIMGAKGLGADLVFAWPTAQIAPATTGLAVPQLMAHELARAERKGKDTSRIMARGTEEYEATAQSPYAAAEYGEVDAVIPPSETRGRLIEGLRLLDRKVVYPPAKKHGNIPL